MLKYIIALLCLYSFTAKSAYRGTYNLKVLIGEKTYKDILIIESVSHGFAQGRFIVPGAFDAPLEAIIYGQDLMEGSFTARENGREFEVKIEAQFEGDCLITGVLSDYTTIFAHFNGKKEGCHE